MRDTFMSNLRRVKDSKRSGKGTADIYIPKWSLYDRLKFLQKTVVQSTSTTNLTISSEKLDNIVSQVEETSNESLKQYQLHIAEDNQEKEIVNEELPVINIYYNDSMEKFMIAPTEESSDSTTDLSVSSPASSAFQPLQPICAPVLQTTLHNETVSTSTALTSSALTSSASKIKDVENKMYTKRGYAKRKANFDPNDNSAIMVEAVTAIKTLCKQDPNNSTNSSNSSTDSAHSLGLFIAARLREMTTDQRKLCENEILKILSQF
ncbi:hypothetical protein ALC62_09693 [Cyphomyrmex costatus]|uniref:MADF domain-containing protein n=1 Tax=Cyphomyrmex costatus TaxID=456900 RepID=A0A151IF88_9HYME|nr:hypothetical protein ALC62_09693 [Cyphomyrmex costatus]